MTTRATDGAGVTRFGQTFYVVPLAAADPDTMTREHAERTAVARFPFDGPPTRKNPACARAYAAACEAVRTFARIERRVARPRTPRNRSRCGACHGEGWFTTTTAGTVMCHDCRGTGRK